MLRIVEEKTTNNSIALRLDGSIVGQWVEVLRSSCEQVFQSDGHVILYVVDGSFFASSAAVNPALTIMANALRVGDHLLERMK